jgi:hypothetical protein
MSLAAAGIHFAVIGDHFDEQAAAGIFFAIVAWGQALWAIGMVVAPGRRLVVAGLIGNAGVIAVWTASRTVGVPVGPEPWTAEAVGTADLLATTLQIVIVIGCAVLLRRREERREARTIRRAPALGIAVSLVLLTSAAIATGAEHTHGDGSAAGDHHAGAEAAAEDHDHELAGGDGEPDLAQIDTIRAAMAKYRDVNDAYTAGWRKEHQDWPELGAHFYRGGEWDGSFPQDAGVNLREPEYLMYSRFLTGRWKLVAVAYVVDQAEFPDPPADLTGALYHEHVWNCIDDGEELEEEDWGVISQEECAIMGSEWSPGGVWMTHVWLVDNPLGIFAETNPTLDPLNLA